MKLGKKIFCAVLAAALILTAFPLAYASAETLTFKKSARPADDGGVEQYYKVSGCSAAAGGVISVPDTYDGLPVLEIGESAFSGCAGITEINIPSSVDKIGISAFENCIALEKVSYQGSAFESSSRVIDAAAFKMCIALKKVLLPGGLVEIREKAFASCSALEEISLPDTVKTIGASAFSLCSSLKTVSLPASVTTVSENAFISCGGITSFAVDSGNTKYKAVDGVLFTADGKKLVQYPLGKSEKAYVVPEGTQTVGNAAFSPSAVLTEVSFPETLKTVEPYAFHRCALLSEVYFPSKLETIGSMAFADCPELECVVLPASLKSFSSAFYNSGLMNVIIEDGVSEIGEKSFESCSALTGVSIPESVGEIKYAAFKGCTSLSYLDVPASVTAVGNGAFDGCTALTLSVSEGSSALAYAKENSIPYIVKGGSTVVRELTGISINTLPDKTDCFKGEKIPTAGLSILASYSDGTSGIITSGFTVSPSTAAYVGTQSVTVTYQGKTAKFSVNVKENASSQAKNISIATLPDKTKYNYKEMLNTAGLTLCVSDGNGNTETIASGYTVITPTYFDSTGNKTVTVEYDGCTASFTVTVSYSFFQFIIMYICLGFLWGY